MNIKKEKHFIIVSWILGFMFGFTSIYGEVDTISTPKTRPNFLIIMVDDISPNAFSCYGNTEYQTPNVDALAEGGVFFNMAWATPMCSPSRALLTTGRYPSRTGVWHNDLRVKVADYGRWDYAMGHLTFARVLREGGYKTAITGKQMALGHYQPNSKYVGFGEYYLHINENAKLPEDKEFDGLFEGAWAFPGSKPVPSRFWHPAVTHNGVMLDTNENDFAPDMYTDYLIDFMSRNKDEPFLAYFPMNLVHDIAGGGLPTVPKQGVIGSNTGGNLKDLNLYVDTMVGRLTSALDDLGIRENTIIIFASDNGTSGASKMHATEEGPRVPFIVNCPGLIQQRGATMALMEFADVFPTLIDFANISMPEDYELDGLSMKSFLLGESDNYRDSIVSYIATARMARTDNWLLEAVDPIYGSSEGRLYRCNGSMSKEDYTLITDFSSPEVLTARNQLLQALERNPFPDLNDPVVREEVIRYDSMPYKHYLEKHSQLGEQSL
ncbi:MAG: sulfatase-like hydrolase/transferase [Coraliomargaritaceae bacterium]